MTAHQEGERRHGRARAAGLVVAARRGGAAADLLGGDARRVDAAAVDRGADPRVVLRALHHPAARGADVLGREVDRVVPSFQASQRRTAGRSFASAPAKVPL